MNFKSNDVRIADIFTIDNIKSYNVPIYQRNYAWTVDNIEALITDIDNEPAGYYLGNIIFTSNDENDTNFDIVDGQQRFTTIALIFLSIYKILNEIKERSQLPDNYNYEYTEIISDIQRRLVAKENKSPRLTLLEPDKEIYTNLINSIILKNKNTKTFSNRILGKRFLSTESILISLVSDSESIEDSTDIEKILDKIIKFYDKLTKAVILSITVTNINDAFTIFTSFNAKGVPLTLLDLLKSTYLKEASDIDAAIIKWDQLLKIFNSDNDEPQSRIITQFIQNNYDAFENESSSSITKNSALKLYEKLFEKNSETYIDILIDRAKLYSLISSKMIRNNEINLPNDTLDKLGQLSRLDSTSIIPILLFILDKYKNGQTSIEIVNRLLNYLISYYVRRNIVVKPKSSNIRGKALQAIRDLEKENNINSKMIEQIMNQLNSIAASDNEFKASLSESVYSLSIPTTRFILVALERHYGTRFDRQHKDTLEEYNDSGQPIWTLEHIMPQSAHTNNHWKQEFIDSGLSEDQILHETEANIHKLGNLTLTGYNAEMSAKSFKNKRDYVDSATRNEVGLKTDLWLNESIPDSRAGETIHTKEKWTISDINRRTDELVEKTLELFKLS